MPAKSLNEAVEMERLLARIRECRICEDLPLGPRPVLRASPSARLLIVGQAPGTKVHASGIPWNDPSGDRLREWLAIDRETFYDEGLVAIVPMGFCYPGRLEKGGDKPPRPECAPAWHPELNPRLKNVKLTLLVGMYAQKYYLGKRKKRTLTETVRDYQHYLPRYWPLPHPSWRSTNFLKRNQWFEHDVLPALRDEVVRIFHGVDGGSTPGSTALGSQ